MSYKNSFEGNIRLGKLGTTEILNMKHKAVDINELLHEAVRYTQITYF